MQEKISASGHAEAGDTEIPEGDAQAHIEAEYRRIIAEQLERMGTCGMTTLEIVHAGEAQDGMGIYRAMVRLVRWDRRAAARLLLGLPVLQYRLLQLLAASWLPEVSHFGGVWLHPAGELQHRDRVTDLRRLVLDFEAHYLVTTPGASGDSLWTLPPETR
ncbi:hypothetical protein [Ramlibacter albus]|uniref:Uncharacterized protein n=1 Tax=Ramlibacter albus TaxID=2079448 RepID=A0A923M7K9_9BURK|nr:hypothetical protein [Ramlibacter albus]MBC5765732.1 hypothetical protein [Ramlibacter albus]